MQLTLPMPKESQATRILRLLKRPAGATNVELNRIAFRYAARINDLRREGHKIESTKLKGSLWRFRVVND